MEKITHTSIQAKVFDFALLELVQSKRNAFKPLWSVDSWVKFLIWLTLNCGLSGERESLNVFAEALGPPLTRRMRRIFFERHLEDLSLHVMGDPAEQEVLVMPLSVTADISKSQVASALEMVGLTEKIILDRTLWKQHEAIIAIPWKPQEHDS